MEIDVSLIIDTIVSILVSGGFWTYLVLMINKRSAANKMLLGLGHDRIIFLGEQCIERGYITTDEYENLNDYLYVPYAAMGGNGSAERIMNRVKKLPSKKEVTK